MEHTAEASVQAYGKVATLLVESDGKRNRSGGLVDDMAGVHGKAVASGILVWEKDRVRPRTTRVRGHSPSTGIAGREVFPMS